MTKAIFPVLRRAKIASVVAENAHIFNEETGFAGILMPLWVDENQILPCLAPRLLVRSTHPGKSIESVEALKASSSLDFTRRLQLAEILLGLMGNNTLHTALEAAADSAPLGKHVHHINVLILPSMLAFVNDDPGCYIEENVENFCSAPDSDATRAPLCTLLIPPAGSAHQAIEQSDMIIRDFEIYRGLSDPAVAPALGEIDLKLAAPTRQDIERISR